MRRYVIVGLAALLAVGFATNASAEGNRKRKRRKDGSCLNAAPADEVVPTKDQKRDRKRRRDGSCLSAAPADQAVPAKDQKRDRKRRRDGSCKA